MARGTGWKIAVATSVILVAVGCSDTGEDGGDPEATGAGETTNTITREEYAEQAMQICRDNVAELDAALAEEFPSATAPPEVREGRRVVRDRIVPLIREGNQEMRELERPPGDAEALEQLFADVDAVLDELIEQPDPFFRGPNPFADVDPEFVRLGMVDCAG